MLTLDYAIPIPYYTYFIPIPNHTAVPYYAIIPDPFDSEGGSARCSGFERIIIVEGES